MSQPGTPQASLIASLFIQAVREGQTVWFRVASNSMFPVMRAGDEVRIQPAKAHEIRPGEIAAFETANGLVLHRIIAHQQTQGSVRLLQMSDVELLAGWVKEQAVVGKVVCIRRKNRQVNLQHSIAKRCGMFTALIRYKLYLYNKNGIVKILLRGCSRLVILLGYWCLQCCCASPVVHD